MPEFNFKSSVVTRKVRETEIILEEVIPSPFFVEKELKDIILILLKFILTYIKKLVLCLMLMVELFLINL